MTGALQHSEQKRPSLKAKAITDLIAVSSGQEQALYVLNPPAFEALARWAGRFPTASADHYVFPWCEYKHLDPTRPTRGWRTAWRHALRRAGFHCRFHDLRVTCITKMAESNKATELTIMGIAGHVSRRMLEHYSRIRLDAKRAALDAIARDPDRPEFRAGVNQNVHQLKSEKAAEPAKPLN